MPHRRSSRSCLLACPVTSPIVRPYQFSRSPHISPPASSPRRPVNRLAAHSTISLDGERRREGERGEGNPACFAPSDGLRRYYGDADSKLRSRLRAVILYIYRYGPLAQSREQRLCTPEVAGWIPAWSTIYDTGRLLNSGRPVFRTANLPVAHPRLPCCPSCRRAGRADCLPQNRPAAYDTMQFVISSEMIRAAGLYHTPYVGIPAYSHSTENQHSHITSR